MSMRLASLSFFESALYAGHPEGSVLNPLGEAGH